MRRLAALFHALGHHDWKVVGHFYATAMPMQLTGVDPDTALKVLHGCTYVYYGCARCAAVKFTVVGGRYQCQS